jgi:hypothetical protein
MHHAGNHLRSDIVRRLPTLGWLLILIVSFAAAEDGAAIALEATVTKRPGERFYFNQATPLTLTVTNRSGGDFTLYTDGTRILGLSLSVERAIAEKTGITSIAPPEHALEGNPASLVVPKGAARSFVIHLEEYLRMPVRSNEPIAVTWRFDVDFPAGKDVRSGILPLQVLPENADRCEEMLASRFKKFQSLAITGGDKREMEEAFTAIVETRSELAIKYLGMIDFRHYRYLALDALGRRPLTNESRAILDLALAGRDGNAVASALGALAEHSTIPSGDTITRLLNHEKKPVRQAAMRFVVRMTRMLQIPSIVVQSLGADPEQAGPAKITLQEIVAPPPVEAPKPVEDVPVVPDKKANF